MSWGKKMYLGLGGMILSSGPKTKKASWPVSVLGAAWVEVISVLGTWTCGGGWLEHCALQICLSMNEVPIKPATRPQPQLLFCLYFASPMPQHGGVRKGHTFPQHQPCFNACWGAFATEGTGGWLSGPAG